MENFNASLVTMYGIQLKQGKELNKDAKNAVVVITQFSYGTDLMRNNRMIILLTNIILKNFVELAEGESAMIDF